MDPAKVVSVRLEDLLGVLDRAADHFVIPCQSMLSLGPGGCPNCRNTLELKSELLKMASILRAEASKGLKQSATKRGHHPAFDEYGEHR